MTITEELERARSRRSRSPYVRTVRTLLRVQLQQAMWYLGIVVVLAVGAGVVIDLVAGLDVSIVQFGRQSGIWFPFAITVLSTSMILPAHVAAGRTRAEFGRATVTVGLLMAVFYAAVLAGAMALEGVLYDAGGWGHRIADGAWYSADPDALDAVFVGHLVSVAAAQMGGALVAVAYHRLGGWWGTVALPVTAGPVLAVMVALSRGFGPEWLTAPLLWGGSVAFTVALAVAFLIAVRRFTMRPVRG